MRKTAVLLALWLGVSTASAQPVPRTPDGHPELGGTWNNGSLTKLTRPRSAQGLVVSAEDAQRVAANVARASEADLAPLDPNAAAPPVNGFTAGYNGFWTDPGKTFGQIGGQYRTSWIVDPADGQLPFSEEGRKRVAAAQIYARKADTPADPEALEPWDRCIISSRGSGGPGMLNNLYNNSYQIVLTRDYLAIEIEMIHDVRVIPIFATAAEARDHHRPAALQPWLGDSVAWWEGDALVVETTHVKHEQGRAGPIFLTPEGKVTERFTRASRGQILYQFEVEDPTYYSRPWRAEMPLNAQKTSLYEYACHEGNYAMSDILRGARVQEHKAAKGTQ